MIFNYTYHIHAAYFSSNNKYAMNKYVNRLLSLHELSE